MRARCHLSKDRELVRRTHAALVGMALPRELGVVARRRLGARNGPTMPLVSASLLREKLFKSAPRPGPAPRPAGGPWVPSRKPRVPRALGAGHSTSPVPPASQPCRRALGALPGALLVRSGPDFHEGNQGFRKAGVRRVALVSGWDDGWGLVFCAHTCGRTSEPQPGHVELTSDSSCTSGPVWRLV